MEQKPPYEVNEILGLTNDYRTSQGLKPLTLNDQLNKSSLAHTQDLTTNNYWAHNNPNGKTWDSFIKDSGYPYKYAGENIANGFRDTGSMMQSWKNSPTHNKNLVNPNYTDIGISIVQGKRNGRNVYYVIQNFGSQQPVITPVTKGIIQGVVNNVKVATPPPIITTGQKKEILKKAVNNKAK